MRFDDSELRESTIDLVRRLREAVADREDSVQWFRAWTPVIGALGRIGTIVGRIGVRLTAFATGREVELFTDHDREIIVEELRAMTEDFPDIADVLFGLHHVDRLTEVMLHDEVTRAAATRVTSVLGAMLERMVSRLVDIAMGNAEHDFGPERVYQFLERFEGVAQELLDRWVPRGLGMLSSVVYEEEE